MNQKNFQILFILLFLSALIIPIALAHEDDAVVPANNSVPDNADAVKQIFPIDSVIILEWAFAALILLIIISIFKGASMSPQGKKVFFVAMVLLVGFGTLYVVGETLYKNVVSGSHGPVHWHADYEIWVCGQKIELKHSEGFSDKVGSPLLHNHNDGRIHIEGTIVNLKDVTVGKFFYSLGDVFNKDTLIVTDINGNIIEKHNGDLCNGVPGTLKFYVNGEPNNEFGNYLIKPFSTVPPGDVLKIDFS